MKRRFVLLKLAAVFRRPTTTASLKSLRLAGVRLLYRCVGPLNFAVSMRPAPRKWHTLPPKGVVALSPDQKLGLYWTRAPVGECILENFWRSIDHLGSGPRPSHARKLAYPIRHRTYYSSRKHETLRTMSPRHVVEGAL